MDELNEARDIAALLDARGKGVTVLATAHGASAEELRLRPAMRLLLRERVFDRIVILRGVGQCAAVCRGDGSRMEGATS